LKANSLLQTLNPITLFAGLELELVAGVV